MVGSKFVAIVEIYLIFLVRTGETYDEARVQPATINTKTEHYRASHDPNHTPTTKPTVRPTANMGQLCFLMALPASMQRQQALAHSNPTTGECSRTSFRLAHDGCLPLLANRHCKLRCVKSKIVVLGIRGCLFLMRCQECTGSLRFRNGPHRSSVENTGLFLDLGTGDFTPSVIHHSIWNCKSSSRREWMQWDPIRASAPSGWRAWRY